jgi:branched-chain amino acid transport system permease protein
MAALTAARARRPLLALGVLVAGLLLASGTSEFHAQEWAGWLIYGLLALSFVFVWGHGGIFSFGQAALFGIGGYAYGVAGIDLIGHTNETFSALVIAAVVAAIVAAAVGYFIFYGNVGDVQVAIITLAASLVLLTVMSSTAGPQYHIGEAKLGGYNGMIGVPPLTHGTPGGTPTALSIKGEFQFVIVVAVLVSLGLAVLLQRPFGRVLEAVRVNQERAQLLGYDVRRVKLLAFVIGGAIAGLAGGLYASWGTFINPSVFTLQQAALVAIWTLVGGRTSILGAFVGVAVVEQLSSWLGGSGSTATPIVLGSVLIAVVLLMPGGIVTTIQMLLRRRFRRRPEHEPLPGSPEVDALLVGNGAHPLSVRVDDVVKRYGGVTAVDGVTLELPPRGVHCLIGPNGAGKSTLFNLLCGRQRPSGGRVLLAGEDITRRRPDERARRGMAIKIQVASLFSTLSAFENLWLAAYAKERNARRASERASETLDWLGMRDDAEAPAGMLSHGAQQWLEIGMVVVTRPQVILLDEPTAGMTRDETARTAELVQRLGEHASVVVVEHDMEFVRTLGAPITMLHEGQVFTSGSLEDLRRDDRVLDIYLGRSGHAVG